AAEDDAPQADAPHDDEQRAAEQLAAALDDQRNRRSDRDERPRAERQHHRVPQREPHGHAERARAPVPLAHRQRRDRHQMIRAESVEETQKKSRGDEQQALTSVTECAGSWVLREGAANGRAPCTVVPSTPSRHPALSTRLSQHPVSAPSPSTRHRLRTSRPLTRKKIATIVTSPPLTARTRGADVRLAR